MLIIAPHPDDEAIGCGGLISRVTRDGGEVFVLWMTIADIRDYSATGLSTADKRRTEMAALNTVKRYARVAEPNRIRRPPQSRACLVDPYRDHLRARRAADPGTPVLHLFEALKALGYTGSLNLLYKHINQGPSPQRPNRALTQTVDQLDHDPPDRAAR
ncbi:PIG-L family deacetylase [Nocardia otitidiscaviarum]|uniref:PIG-L family deacetylase n=1 Tax=Nocardia otitidiscaviarum TaxID=1823 RepID=UPI0018949D42|nr:PIG-L family deacetylase [Nocardia otitidiscaviarum]MBF6240494.1 PIG-L family deacetylase [Nocardia otitidiscaviarum]